jgi:ABC-2 type transport system permease protein
MPLHDIHYQHWDGVHCGIWMRRWVIARNGLTACLRNKFMRNLIVLTWMLALSATAVLFMLGQLLVPDSLLVKWVSTLNEDLQGIASFLTTWLAQHPEISVRTTQNVLFYFFSIFLMPLSIFALGMTIPFLVTRDLASNAIIIYSSKAVTRGDYLLGKFCAAFGLLTITWLGPVCAAWFLGNLLAPDWKFFWHARVPLANALTYGVASMIVLSVLALAVSSVSSKDKSTVSLWFAWWVLGWPLADIASHTKPWLAHLSFSYDIRQIAIAVFDLGSDLKTAQDNVPILGSLLHNVRPETMSALTTPALGGSLFALGVMLALSAWIIHKRVKP